MLELNENLHCNLFNGAITAIIGVAVIKIMYFVGRRRRRAELRAKINRKQDDRLQNFENLRKQLSGKNSSLEITEAEKNILKMSTEELLKALKTKSITCVESLRAYQKKALQVTEELNCVTEFILEAQTWAEELDRRRDISSLPLFGLPMCVKCNIAVRGYLTTMGMAQDLSRGNAKDDAVVVASLKRLGVVPFCLTNIPQTLLSLRCKNPIFGETLHPLDKTRSPGGSSGGDGALVGGGGALIGLGTDIAGSVRIPATLCGIVGFKPTACRLGCRGMLRALPGIQGVVASGGFQGKDVAGVAKVFQSVCEEKLLSSNDITIPPLGFKREIYQSKHKLRIGYSYGFTDVLPPTPAAQRCVNVAMKIFKDQGHEIVQCDIPELERFQDIGLGLMFADEKTVHKRILDADIMEPHLNADFAPFRIPRTIRRLIAWCLTYTPYYRLATYLRIKMLNTEELWDLMADRNNYIELIRSMFKEKNIDVLVSPTLPCAAMKLDHSGKCTLKAQYSAVYNLLDFPAATVPLVKVNKSDLEAMDKYPTFLPFLKEIAKSAKGSEGLPVGIQIASLRWNDELVLRVARELEQVAKEGLLRC